MECLLFGGTREECPEEAYMANPINYLTEKCPPFLFLHGNVDQVIPISGAIEFATVMMSKIGADNVKFQVVDGAHHNIADFQEEWIYDLEAQFLREKLHVEK